MYYTYSLHHDVEIDKIIILIDSFSMLERISYELLLKIIEIIRC